MKSSPAVSWLIKFTLAAAAVLAANRLATLAIGTKVQQPAVTARDGSLITMNRYVREPTPAVALVGSSVTWRLKEEYFTLGGVRNLALAGGSPVTGLTIIASQKALPKLVLIETNVLSRSVDSELVKRFAGDGRSETFLRPVRAAVAAYELWNHAPPDAARLRGVLDDLLAQPPAGFDNRVYLDRAVAQANLENPKAAARDNVELIRKFIAELEQRGTKTLLMEVPFAPEIEETISVKMTREIVREAFPDESSWLTINVPPTQLRWADGLHLDERSALIVTRAIEKAIVGP